MCILKAQDPQTFPSERASESWLGDHNQILSARNGLYRVVALHPARSVVTQIMESIYLVIWERIPGL